MALGSGNVRALDNGAEGVPNLAQSYMNKLRRVDSRNVPVANSVLWDDHVPSLLCGLARRCRDADVSLLLV